MKIIKSLLQKYSVIVIFTLFITISRFMKFNIGREFTSQFLNFFIEMLLFLPATFVLIALFDVWVPKEKIRNHIGDNSGIRGMILIIILGMFQAGPVYGAFPVVYILWKKGCSIRNVFVYIGAFSSLKIPMLTFETSYLGLKFTLLRAAITIPVFLIISEILARYLKNRDFEVKSV